MNRVKIFCGVLCLFYLLGSVIPGFAQVKNSDSYYLHPSFTLDNWTTEDGLPVNSVNQVIQTKDGYLWLATNDGLVRFDGIRFKVFKSDEFPGLPSNRIRRLTNSEDGNLWLQLEDNRLVKFNGKQFQRIDSTHGLNGNQVFSFYKPHKSSDLFFGSSNGITQYKNGELTPYYPEQINQPVSYLYINQQNILWFKEGKSQDLYRFDGKKRIYLASSLDQNNITPAKTLNSGHTLYATLGHIYRYKNKDTEELRLNLPPDFMVLDFYTGDKFFDGFKKGEVLIASSGHGLFKLSKDTIITLNKAFRGTPQAIFKEGKRGLWLMGHQQILHNGNIVFSFDDFMRSQTVDHEGSYWFGTQSAGLFRLKPNLFTIYSENAGFPKRNIYPVFETSDGAIWAGTHGEGIVRIQDDNIQPYKLAPSSGTNEYVRSIIETNNGHLLASILGEGLFKFNKANDNFDKISTPPRQNHIVRHFSVEALFEDSQNYLWAGSTHGLYRQPPGSSEWNRISDEILNPHYIVRNFAEAPDSSLWMATSGGGIYHFKNGRFTTYSTKDGLSSNLIRSFKIDTTSTSQKNEYVLWIGTEDKGLNRLEVSSSGPKFNSLVRYNQQIGLYDNVIHQILEDDYGRFWMSSNRGIFWVPKNQLNDYATGDTRQIESTAYTEQDGLLSREANGGIQPAGIKSSDGQVWFPTQDGLVSIDPQNLLQNNVPPPVQIEEIKAKNKEIPYTEKRTAYLAANQRSFEINYTGLSFMVPEKVRFQYRLKGFNNQWIEAGSRRTAYFTNVPAGEYEFEVLAANNTGVWKDTPTAISVVVAPYFYETNWFYLAIIILGGFLIWITVLLRTRHLKNRQKVLEQSVRERTLEIRQQKAVIEKQAEAQQRFFTNVSHELRTPLTLTIGPLEDLKHKKMNLQQQASEKVTIALRNAKRLLNLVSQILDISRLEASNNKLIVTRDNLAVFVKAIAQNFISLANRKQIQFNIKTPEEAYVWFNHEQMEKVISNLLSNAFKFTPNEHNISIELTEPKNGQILLIVKDAGMGIPEEELPNIFDRFYQSKNANSRLQNGTGIGLALVKELVELHGGTINAKSTIGEGTTFIISLPVAAHTLPHARIDETSHTITAPAIIVDGEDITTLRNSSQLDKEDHKTVLIVEDNTELRQFIAGHLNESYRVIEAFHGKKGLEKAIEHLPDIVISDVMMPEMDGFEMMEQIRKNSSINFIPVIMLTGKDTKEDMLKGLEHGANDYIVKPFDMDELKAKIKSMLWSQKLLKAKFESEASVIKVKRKLKSADQKFIEQVEEAILQNLEDSALSVEKLAGLVNVGRSTLHRKLTTIAGETPVQLIRQIRLEHGKKMIENQAGTISEIAYSVGFESISWFSKCFKERYKVSPSKLLSSEKIYRTN